MQGLALSPIASKEIVVTVGEDDWRTFIDTAGMSVEAYASWCIRIFALQARPGGGKRAGDLGQVKTANRTRRSTTTPSRLHGRKLSPSGYRIALTAIPRSDPRGLLPLPEASFGRCEMPAAR